MKSLNIAGIILAAGKSSRFGSQKLLFPLSDGTPIGIRAAKNLKRVIRNSYAVVSSLDDELAELLINEGYELIHNSNNNGIGSSISCAIKNIEADAYIITLADMPYIHSSTIHSVSHLLYSGHKIVVPRCKERNGHPVGITKDYKNDLITLSSDIGAKEIIKNNYKDLTSLHTADTGVLTDIDFRHELK